MVQLWPGGYAWSSSTTWPPVTPRVRYGIWCRRPSPIGGLSAPPLRSPSTAVLHFAPPAWSRSRSTIPFSTTRTTSPNPQPPGGGPGAGVPASSSPPARPCTGRRARRPSRDHPAEHQSYAVQALGERWWPTGQATARVLIFRYFNAPEPTRAGLGEDHVRSPISSQCPLAAILEDQETPGVRKRLPTPTHLHPRLRALLICRRPSPDSSTWRRAREPDARTWHGDRLFVLEIVNAVNRVTGLDGPPPLRSRRPAIPPPRGLARTGQGSAGWSQARSRGDDPLELRLHAPLPRGLPRASGPFEPFQPSLSRFPSTEASPPRHSVASRFVSAPFPTGKPPERPGRSAFSGAGTRMHYRVIDRTGSGDVPSPRS